MRTLRAETARDQSETNALRTRADDSDRRAAALEASARTHEAAARASEAAARTQRDENARLKSTLAAVRAQCAADVRRRDAELAKLRAHLASRPRGVQKAPGSGSVGPAGGAMSISIQQGRGMRGGPAAADAVPDVADAEYSLAQETNDFLTQLSAGLSEENDALIGLLRGVLERIGGLLGLPHNRPVPSDCSSPSGSAGAGSQARSSANGGVADAPLIHSPPSTHQSLAGETSRILALLTDLLTNPSFAPIEEVHARDDEILRLREGWERMEQRWHEAIALMNGWKRRMLSGGEVVQLEEVRRGLRLGEGLDSPSRRVLGILEEDDGEDQMLDGGSSEDESEEMPQVDDLPEIDDQDQAPLEELPEEGIIVAEVDGGTKVSAHTLADDIEKPLQEKRDLNAAAKPARDAPPAKDAKKNADGDDSKENDARTKATSSRSNIAKPAATRPKPSIAAPVRPGNKSNAPAASKAAQAKRPITKGVPEKPQQKQPHQRQPSAQSNVPKSRNVSTSTTTAATKPPKTVTSKATKPARPSLSIEEKLRIAEREAAAAASQNSSPLEARKSRRMTHAQSMTAEPEPEPEADDSEESVFELPPPVPQPVDDGEKKRARRTRISGRPRRRKSTLSPEELEELMNCAGDAAE